MNKAPKKKNKKNNDVNKKKNKKNNDMNKKNLSSLTNARDSVSGDETLAPKFIPGFNVKGVSSKPLGTCYIRLIQNFHLILDLLPLGYSLRTKLTVLHQGATPNSAPIYLMIDALIREIIKKDKIKFMNNMTKNKTPS
jgi:hypothetical protein